MQAQHRRGWAAGLLVGGAAFSSLAGCGDWTGTSDPHRPGAALGTFHVAATQKMTTCGEGALGSTASWAFDVKLSRGETTLFWDNGAELIPGSLAEDKVTFAFKTGVLVDMREGQAGELPPCSIRRVDEASGTLDSAGPTVSSFEGSLSYAFAAEPLPMSDCSDLVSGSMAVLAALPCAMTYDLKATLTEPPADQGSSAARSAGEGEEP